LHLPFKLGCIFFHTVLLACRAYAVARILQLKQAGKLFLTVSLAAPSWERRAPCECNWRNRPRTSWGKAIS
jgi:hypothetical protein